ncbi:MAG TPA: hypothetical protein RMH99_15265, partial [Sandaracinaceae bacterium LLY-WYZ-13_1]|nr:hypothetical protein [Sandaracinaceae bacterium LLY-WYZ-13_1]
RGPLADDCPEGPAVAWPDARAAAPAYRDDGSRGRWRAAPGSLATQLADLRRAAFGCDAFALATLVLTSAPLLVVGRSLLG